MVINHLNSEMFIQESSTRYDVQIFLSKCIYMLLKGLFWPSKKYPLSEIFCLFAQKSESYKLKVN